SIPVDYSAGEWLRLQGDFRIESREWDWWKFTQWIVKFYNGDEVVKTNFIRIQRLIKEDHLFTTVFFDVKFPEGPFTRCEMSLWNADSPHTILMDNLKIFRWGEN